MKLDEGKTHIQSYCGALLSLILTFTILVYSYQKADVLIAKKDVDILSTINDGAFDSDFIFDYDSGLNFAFAFTAYDSNPEPILNETIGRLQFNHFRWGADNDEGVYKVERNKIDSQHTCTGEELGLEGDRANAKFLPVFPNSKAEVEFYQKKLQCIDEEDLYLYGDFNSATGDQLNVQFVRCNNATRLEEGLPADCLSDEDITTFTMNKFILVLYNQVRFDSSKYGEDAITKESRVQWVPINS